ncbi:MAG: family 10 glycosylhydrolase [bacterium]|nr:family 10 glycosylhydrolase [bacterium]
MKKHLLLPLIGILVLSIIVLIANAETIPESRGVWMSRDVIYSGPELMEQTFYKLAQSNFNRVLINVQYKGATIYPSDVVANAGGPRQRSEFIGRDPLQEAIEIGHRRGLEIVAWFEYGLMAHWSGSDTTDCGPILTQHPGWRAIKKNGSGYVKNENGVFHWLDPAHPEVAQFMEDLFGEIAERYPDLDGIETDRIRYPSLEFSYSDISRSHYTTETGGTDPINIDYNHPQWQQWITWREEQITAIAHRIYRRAKNTNPAIFISAAVAPPYMLYYHDNLQRWDIWADSGYVDALEPMLYLDDASFPYQLAEAVQLAPPDFYLYPGIVYRNDASLQFQINQVREKGCKGVTLWYYGYLSNNTLTILKNDLFNEPVNLPHNDIIIDNSSSIQFQYSGNWEQHSGGYRGNYLVAEPGDDSVIATWHPKLMKTAEYAIYARWISDSSNTTDACYKITNDTKTISVIVNQRQNSDSWVFLISDTISYDAPISIQLSNFANGNVVADAVRLVVSTEFELLDLNVPDSLHLELKFSRNLDRESAENISCYAVDGSIDVVSAILNDNDPSIVTLTTTPLTANYQYSLTIEVLQDENRNILPFTQVEFDYAPQETHLLIDNGDQNFQTYGNWTTCTNGSGYIGPDYLVSTCGSGENRAQWWHFIEVDGYYEVAVRWPAGINSLAEDVSYSIMHNFGVDTVRVNQQIDGGLWNVLGCFYYRAGKVASVLVSNDICQGVVTADAVRIRRVLETTDIDTQVEDVVPSLYRLYQNYPNPFNPSTTIEFELPSSGKIILKVLNLLGQEVETLVARELRAGRHQVRFDGNGLSSGVYLYRWIYLPDGQNSRPVAATKKMLLLR